MCHIPRSQLRVNRSFHLHYCRSHVYLHTISVTNPSEVHGRRPFVRNGPGQDTSVQLQMCHRQDRRQSQNDRWRIVRNEEWKKGEKTYTDCIQTSSVRLVVRDNGGIDKALFVGEETVCNVRALEQFFLQ